MAKAKAKAKKAVKSKSAATKGVVAGLGREGTVTRFFQDQILAGKENAEIVKAATKKFPENKINPGYASWYRSQLKSAGLLKAA